VAIAGRCRSAAAPCSALEGEGGRLVMGTGHPTRAPSACRHGGEGLGR
jgi:hypothetical protein